MDSSLQETLCSTVAETLERLTFMLCLIEEDEERSPIANGVVGCVTFEGPFSGMFVVILPRTIREPLAMNMLGIDEGVSDEDCEDALREVTNVLCGNLLPVIAGVEANFRIMTPRVFDTGDGKDWPSPKEGYRILFETAISVEDLGGRVLLYEKTG